MEQQVVDSTLLLTADTIQKAPPQSDYSIGSLIPFTPVEEVFPSEMITPGSDLSGVYNFSVRHYGNPVPEGSINADFCLISLSLSLILLTFLTVYGRKNVLSIFSSLSFRRQHDSSALATQGILSWPGLVKYLFVLLNISLYVTLSVTVLGFMYFNGGKGSIKMTLTIIGSLMCGLILRHFICTLTGLLSGHKALFREYLSVVYNVWFLIALIAFINSVITLYTPIGEPKVLIYMSSGLMILLFLVRITKLLNIFLRRHVPILYFILYLCALEVLPVLVMLKLFGAF